MDNDTQLIVTYGALKEMLNEFQTDGYNSDRCPGSIYIPIPPLDADEEIQNAVKDGIIKAAKK